MRRKVKAFWEFVQRSTRPNEYPDKEPEEILRVNGWHDKQINTIAGRFACLSISIAKLKMGMWKAIFTKLTTGTLP